MPLGIEPASCRLVAWCLNQLCHRVPPPKKVLDGKFRGRRLVGTLRLRWKDSIRRDSSLLQNIRGWRKLAGDRDIWKRTVEEARVRCRLSRHWKGRRRRMLISEEAYTFWNSPLCCVRCSSDFAFLLPVVVRTSSSGTSVCSSMAFWDQVSHPPNNTFVYFKS
jgi:hypothetical protein